MCHGDPFPNSTYPINVGWGAWGGGDGVGERLGLVWLGSDGTIKSVLPVLRVSFVQDWDLADMASGRSL